MSRSPQSSIVTKCAAVLDAVSLSRRPLAFADVVEQTSFAKSSCHRILAVLQSEELIAYDKDTRTYSTGSRVRKWANSNWHRTDLLDVSSDTMDTLSEAAGMNTALSILDGHSILYLRTSDQTPVRFADRAGDRAPLHCTAAGKVFLAYLSPGRLSDLLKSIRLDRFTDHTIGDKSVLEAQLSDVVSNGFSRAIGEEHVHVMGIGAPIWNAQNQVAACLSFWATTRQMTEHGIGNRAPMLMEAARTISVRLGWEDTFGASKTTN